MEQDIHESSEEWQGAEHFIMAHVCLPVSSSDWGTQCLMLQDSVCMREESSITARVGRPQEFLFPTHSFLLFLPQTGKTEK